MAGLVGATGLNKLLKYFSHSGCIFNASVSELIEVSGIGENLAGRIHCFKKEDLEKELKAAAKLDLKIIAITEQEPIPPRLVA